MSAILPVASEYVVGHRADRDHVVINCRDVEALADWYVRVLGIRREVFAGGRVALRFGDRHPTRSGALGATTSYYFRDPEGNLIEIASYLQA